MRLEKFKLTEEQRNRLLSPDTIYRRDANFYGVTEEDQNGNEMYRYIFDSKGNHVGGTLSIRGQNENEKTQGV